MEKRNEYLNNIKEKRKQIKEYLQEINIFDTSRILENLKDVFYIYGFTVEEVKNFVNYKGDYSEYSTNYLIQMDGMVNTLLYEIKKIAKAS